MEHHDLLRLVVGVLEGLDLPYLVTGSTATIFYGEPRFTADIDIVVDLPADRVDALVAAFGGGEFYLDEESVRQAVARRGQFNLVHATAGLKVDFMIPQGGRFDRSRFARGRRVSPGEHYRATFASPEDVILKKMVFYREGGSEKHLRDIAGVLEISGGELDRAYLDRWVEELGLVEVWSTVLQRLRPD